MDLPTDSPLSSSIPHSPAPKAALHLKSYASKWNHRVKFSGIAFFPYYYSPEPPSYQHFISLCLIRIPYNGYTTVLLVDICRAPGLFPVWGYWVHTFYAYSYRLPWNSHFYLERKEVHVTAVLCQFNVWLEKKLLNYFPEFMHLFVNLAEIKSDPLSLHSPRNLMVSLFDF